MQRDPATLKAALADLEQRQLKRTRRVGIAPELLNFCSNDYLGLSNHPEVTRAFIDSASRHGVGSGASHLVTGHGPEHEALEEELAAFTGREKALVFSTGYMANMGVIGALADQNAAIVSDKLNHASLIDGCRLSGAEVKRYRHGDATHAGELMAALESEARLLVTDGVFSMDGDLAPLPELARLTRAANAWLVVDDAHGLGVVGATGRGCCEQFALSDPHALDEVASAVAVENDGRQAAPLAWQSLRERSRGKFYADGWSTARHPPINTYLITSLLMLAVMGVIYALLAPLSGEPAPVENTPQPVQVLPAPP